MLYYISLNCALMTIGVRSVLYMYTSARGFDTLLFIIFSRVWCAGQDGALRYKVLESYGRTVCKTNFGNNY